MRKKENYTYNFERAYEFGLTKRGCGSGWPSCNYRSKTEMPQKKQWRLFHIAKNDIGVATACGLSNISFGLPERMFVNSSFMSIAISHGLTMAIANPSQDLLMHSMFAADLLMNKP